MQANFHKLCELYSLSDIVGTHKNTQPLIIVILIPLEYYPFKTIITIYMLSSNNVNMLKQ